MGLYRNRGLRSDPVPGVEWRPLELLPAAYDPSRDFTRVRDFLAATIRRVGTLFTWDVSRWNYARHFVVPPGFSIRSMADDDVEARRAVLGLSFNHADPAEWATAETYRELQRAPDYRRDLDLCAVAPEGTLAACYIAWSDAVNRVGTFEPVGTHPAYRRRAWAVR